MPVMNDGAGSIERVGPLVRRLLAPNPSPFTFTGTLTHVVGEGEVAVIDPGPDIPAHVQALLAAIEGERVSMILVTHTHRDHSPAARLLAAATGAPIVGCAPLRDEDAGDDDGPRADDAFDRLYAPDRVLADGEAVEGPGWSLEAVATPGHTPNHLCFALPQANALFSGDHVMGWSTTIVSPPEGDMAAYMASLEKLQARDDAVYYPAHGPSIETPRRHVRALILHRRQREAQILGALGKGEGRLAAMVAAMYSQVDPRLHPAAERSVLAHLIDLEGRGIVVSDGDRWRLAAGSIAIAPSSPVASVGTSTRTRSLSPCRYLKLRVQRSISDRFGTIWKGRLDGPRRHERFARYRRSRARPAGAVDARVFAGFAGGRAGIGIGAIGSRRMDGVLKQRKAEREGRRAGRVGPG